MKHVLPLCVQMVVERGLAPRAQELLINGSALAETALHEQQRLGRGEDRGCLCSHWGDGGSVTATLCGGPTSHRLSALPWELCRGSTPPRSWDQAPGLWKGRGGVSPLRMGAWWRRKRRLVARGTRSAARPSGCWGSLDGGLVPPELPCVSCGRGWLHLHGVPALTTVTVLMSGCLRPWACWPHPFLMRPAAVGCTLGVGAPGAEAASPRSAGCHPGYQDPAPRCPSQEGAAGSPSPGGTGHAGHGHQYVGPRLSPRLLLVPRGTLPPPTSRVPAGALRGALNRDVSIPVPSRVLGSPSPEAARLSGNYTK